MRDDKGAVKIVIKEKKKEDVFLDGSKPIFTNTNNSGPGSDSDSKAQSNSSNFDSKCILPWSDDIAPGSDSESEEEMSMKSDSSS